MKRFRLIIPLFCFMLSFVACGSKEEKPVKTSLPVVTEMKRVFKKNENLGTLVKNMLSDEQIAVMLLNTLKIYDFPFRKCLPGDSLILVREDGNFKKFVYFQNPAKVYYVVNDGNFFTFSMKYPYMSRITTVLRGCINSTLYESMLKRGETPMLVYKFADIFAWEIDFTTETHNGDSFVVVFEKVFCDSQFFDYSNIVAVRYKGKVGEYYGIYFNDPAGYDDYYNLKGESLRKALLKSPLRYSSISSYFAKSRYHPILKVWRPHHGLDYSAPKGTPVSSIGDGVVSFKGWKGGYGNLIEIKHKNNFKTRYGHLSGFAKGIYQGKHVKMGELIGYVGSTGLSTGPHLHFELHKDGVPINPLTVKLPRAPSVKKEYFEQFAQVRDSLIQVINNSSADVP